MSYLKLDRTRIKYISPNTTRGGIILSQVVDSECGPDNPVLVSSVEELDLYFGRSFTEREYFEELLSNNVTLLLTTPTKDPEVPEVDISGYEIIDKIKDPKEDVLLEIRHQDQLPEPGKDYQKFLEEVGGKKYYVSEEKEYYIYHHDEWIASSLIPKTYSPESLSNKDTLRLTNKGWKGNGEWTENRLPWCWPKYSSPQYTPKYTEEPDIKSLMNSLKSNSPEDNIGFVLDFSGITEGIKKEDEWTYLVVPISEEGKIQFYVGEEGDSLPPDIFPTNTNNNRVRIPQNIPLQEQVDIIITSLRKNGWKCKGSGLVWKLYSRDFLQDLRFYNIPGLIFQSDPDITHNILSILSERHKRVEFFSKISGKGDEDIKVEVTQTQGKTEWYRVIISRYDYQEIFEGPLYLELDEDTNTYISLENMINNGSSLVTLKVYQSWSYIDGEGDEIFVKFQKNNPDDGLPSGSYTLSRAIPQSPWSPDDYWRGIESLLEFGVSEDFLMIPRIEDYLRIGVKPDESWYTEYKDFLDYATSKNCQVLVSNHPYYFGYINTPGNKYTFNERPENPEMGSLYLTNNGAEVCIDGGWKTIFTPSHPRWKEIKDTLSDGYTGNQRFNYLIKNDSGGVVKDLDPDNRLVYFFRDMTYNGWSRPAWYIFLRGILSGEYSIETNDIIYQSPSEFYTEDEEPGESLEKCKSNFLSNNSHIYYYRRFFSHPGDWKYNNSILSRFCMDKVSNTVSRDFPKYLSKETTGDIIRGLQGILSELKQRYPIIYSLDINSIEEDPYKQTLSVYLNLGIRETLDKDVKLSVTLNFNFT